MRFWCLQTLADACRVHLSALDPNDAAALRAAVASWVHEACVRTDPPVPPFIKNKLAQVTALMVWEEGDLCCWGNTKKTTKRDGERGSQSTPPPQPPLYRCSLRHFHNTCVLKSVRWLTAMVTRK